jgi:hypothetical protein
LKALIHRWLIAVIFSMVSVNALADYAAVAYTRDWNWGGWAVGSTQKAAEAEAIAGCKRANPELTCKVRYPVAISLAEGPNRIGFGTSEKSKIDAEASAKKECAAPSCKANFSSSKPGFYAVYVAYDADKPSNFFIQHGADTGFWAIEQGKQNCEKNHGTRCELHVFGAMKGKFGGVNTQPAKIAESPQQKSCRPNTPTVRCQSQCVNGNCVVTYENGCKMNVQVHPTFNSFNNRWDYPAPQC